MFKFLGNFSVIPSLPEELEPLREIAYNIFWTWNQDSIKLFRRIDREIWEETNHNPIKLLGRVSQERLKELSSDYGFISHMNRVYLQLQVYLEEVSWYQENYKYDSNPYIAYFSAEFGLTECLQIYSGGLGVLSGDHLKSASDLGIPLVAVGLCYAEGYFQQYLTNDGWQQERYEPTDFYNQPMMLVKNKKGAPIKIALDFPGRKVYIQVWKIQVGRLPLYLLDTNVEENSPEDKQITRTLYGGDNETRIQQEIVLGIGGIRMLHELNVVPLVCHMNEGHSAFLGLERLRILQNQYGLSHQEARNINFYSNIFTTHTPVPAGIDIFSKSLVEKYLGDFYRNELHISGKEFYQLGTIEKDKEPENFNMAHLAMNMAGFVNGVSKLHGDVSKNLWVEGFKGIPFDEIPIDYVTNGVHMQTHLSNEMRELLVRYGGESFFDNVRSKEHWKRIAEIPDEELWRTHERRRERLVAFARQRLYKQILQRGGSRAELNSAKETLNPGALTIGFARRFATYKRATLIFRDIERLASILCNKDYPVQLIIAGKAHPKDDAGKELIQEVIQLSKEEHLRKRIVFLENYDMNVARYMVQGCDIWLNNPRRPYEASGTSGMKIIANGGLNFSVLDGWWDEAFNREVGWRIGDREEFIDKDYQDEIEARLIYEIMEKEIVPVFYSRGEDKLPREWITMMKNSMIQLGPVFNTDRMVEQYTEKFYLKALDRRKRLMKNNWKLGKEFTVWKENVYRNWEKVRIVEFNPEANNGNFKVGTSYPISAIVELGDLTPDDVEVQIYFGDMNKQGAMHANQYTPMKYTRKVNGSNTYRYKGEIDCVETGNFGYTLRILPKHELLIDKFELGLIRWA